MAKITLPPGGDVERVKAVDKLARELLIQFNLGDYLVKWDRSTKRAGLCDSRSRYISLSAPLMSLWPITESEETIRHEIAHALTPGHGHDITWRATARCVGAKPTRCYSRREAIPPKYIGTCPKGHKFYRERLTKSAHRMSCGVCRPWFDAKFRITWRRNEV